MNRNYKNKYSIANDEGCIKINRNNVFLDKKFEM